MNSKSPVNLVVWNPYYFEKIAKKKSFSGCPQKCYHRFMNIVPSSGETLTNLNLPLRWILRRFEVLFYFLSENAVLLKRLINQNSFKSTNTVLWPGAAERFWKWVGQVWKSSDFKFFSTFIFNTCRGSPPTCPTSVVTSNKKRGTQKKKELKKWVGQWPTQFCHHWLWLRLAWLLPS